jgi:hypothetical protein
MSTSTPLFLSAGFGGKRYETCNCILGGVITDWNTIGKWLYRRWYFFHEPHLLFHIPAKNFYLQLTHDERDAFSDFSEPDFKRSIANDHSVLDCYLIAP